MRLNQTDSELKLWKYLRRRQLNGLRFLRQFSVGNYIIDFYCPQLKIGIEVDGGQHNERGKKKKDNDRSLYLDKYGIKILRYWNNQVMNNIQGVVEDIKVNIEKTPPDLPFTKGEEKIYEN